MIFLFPRWDMLYISQEGNQYTSEISWVGRMPVLFLSKNPPVRKLYHGPEGSKTNCNWETVSKHILVADVSASVNPPRKKGGKTEIFWSNIHPDVNSPDVRVIVIRNWNQGTTLGTNPSQQKSLETIGSSETPNKGWTVQDISNHPPRSWKQRVLCVHL